jgi:hypothetical protein
MQHSRSPQGTRVQLPAASRTRPLEVAAHTNLKDAAVSHSNTRACSAECICARRNARHAARITPGGGHGQPVHVGQGGLGRHPFGATACTKDAAVAHRCARAGSAESICAWRDARDAGRTTPGGGHGQQVHVGQGGLGRQPFGATARTRNGAAACRFARAGPAGSVCAWGDAREEARITPGGGHGQPVQAARAASGAIPSAPPPAPRMQQ